MDFTNPVGIVTRALLDAGHRAIGLCNVAIGFQRAIAPRSASSRSACSWTRSGLNHLTWIRAVYLDGERRARRRPRRHMDALRRRPSSPPTLIRELGAIPSYYLRYFYTEDERLAELRRRSRARRRSPRSSASCSSMYRDPALAEKPALLERRGGAFYSEAATQLVAALASDSGEPQVVDVRNGGALPGLAADDVVELPARIGARGRSRSRSRRSRPSCSASCSTWRPTSGWRPRPR